MIDKEHEGVVSKPLPTKNRSISNSLEPVSHMLSTQPSHASQIVHL